jgi:hypothetical protein
MDEGMNEINECRAHGGMILTRENQELGEKPVPVPLCPPQIPLY